MRATPIQIFYTDDDRDDQDFFRDALMELGSSYTLYTQSMGDELMDLLNQPPPKPDLIFLDLNMPYKNGIQVLQEIRNSSRFDHIPVVILSTSTSEQAIEKCKSIGADMYVTKPNSYDDLKKVINNVLSVDWLNHKMSGRQFVTSSN